MGDGIALHILSGLGNRLEKWGVAITVVIDELFLSHVLDAMDHVDAFNHLRFQSVVILYQAVDVLATALDLFIFVAVQKYGYSVA